MPAVRLPMLAPAVVLAGALVAMSMSASGCASPICSGCTSDNNGAQCTFDSDCGAGNFCTDGRCSGSLPVGGGEGEGQSVGEGEGSPGEGEGSSGEGEGSFGEGEGSSSSEGEGEGEGAPGTTFTASAEPELVDALPSCACTLAAPSMNLDVTYVASGNGAVCGRPASGDPSCGVGGGTCPCGNVAGASWFASDAEDVREQDTWIIGEAVEQVGGSDGTFIVRISVADDCQLSPGSDFENVNFGCFDADCESNTFGCANYANLGPTCANAAQLAASEATSSDCLVRGPSPVRVHIQADGAGAFTREFCGTFSAGDVVDAVTVRRQGGSTLVSNTSSQLHEIAVGGDCS